LASLTKVVATTTTVMTLVDEHVLSLDAPVRSILPAFAGPTPAQTRSKGLVTVAHLLAHASGLPAYRPFHRIEGDARARLQHVLETPLEHEPGMASVYSDIGFIVLGLLIEAVTGESLSVCATRRVWQPLGMSMTCFQPGCELSARIVPTEYSAREQGFVHGHVHDENAFGLGGVAGHAGVFSTAGDLAALARALLADGTSAGEVVFSKGTVSHFTQRAGFVAESSRCLGWDSPGGASSGGVYLSDASYGHTGFTGTSMWIDPDNCLYVVLLTNAVHPSRSSKTPGYFDWRQRLHSGVYEALGLTTKNPRLSWRPRWQVSQRPAVG